MKHVKRFLALSLAAALLAGCVSCGNSDEKTSPTGGGSGVDSTGDGGTLRIAMTCAALPNTDSEPTEGQEGYRFVSFQLYDALVKWDASSETEAGRLSQAWPPPGSRTRKTPSGGPSICGRESSSTTERISMRTV